MSRKTVQTDAFWRNFVTLSAVDAGAYEVCSFGDNPAMATELADLVLAGTKRATASLRRNYAEDRDPLPCVGDFVVVVDGDGTPRCIWRTTEIVIKPLIAVDERFAWDEGEGDRSRACWLEDHRRYFGRQAARQGFAMHDEIVTVFERFVVVWPLSIADRDHGTKR